MPNTDADAPSVSLSFANNFWGKDDAGVAPLLERMHNAKVTGDELKNFYSARAAIEEEYARKLLNLARKPLGSSEGGTLRMSLDVVRSELEAIGKGHQHVAQQMKSELDEQLAAFHGGMKERRKIVQNGIEKLHKGKQQQTHAVNKARDRYEQDCLKIKGYLAQGHMVMGQEERKNKAKLEKTQLQLSTTSSEYEQAVKALEETTGRWNREWKAACDKFQDLEEERIDFMKSSLWSFANIASTVCVSDDASCEKIRLSLEDCEVEKDISMFIKESGTGQEIPDPPRFINFCKDNASDAASEASEDDYSVAQFQRTLNPAYRSSSPRPASVASKDDSDPWEVIEPPSAQRDLQHESSPDNTPRKAAVHAPSSHNNTPTRSVQQQAPPQQQQLQQRQPPQQQRQQQQIQALEPAPVPAPLYDGTVARQQRQVQPPPPQPSFRNYEPPRIEDYPEVPHNEYPQDGMTAFCRTNAPSDLSSNTSNNRPASRDSASDCSAAYSFTSPETSQVGALAPLKSAPPPALNGSDLSSMSSDVEEVQKKRGFFGRSPFGRKKSKGDKDRPQSKMITAGPASRSTWGPTNKSVPNLSTGSRQGIDRKDFAMNGSVSPEPADPRASFQLSIGNNVFDVASPDAHPRSAPVKDHDEETDPMAQALANLKNLGKQAAVRQSADRYAGLPTPAPGENNANNGDRTPSRFGNKTTPIADRSKGGPGNPSQAPPPSYDQQTPSRSSQNPTPRAQPSPAVNHLGAPQPAFTSKQMQKTTQRYTNAKENMFSKSSVDLSSNNSHNRTGSFDQPPPRPSSQQQGYMGQSTPTRPPTGPPSAARSNTPSRPGTTTTPTSRAPSPTPQPPPFRSTSPRPSLYGDDPRGRSNNNSQSNLPRAASPNPYLQGNANAGSQPRPSRPPSATPQKPRQNSFDAGRFNDRGPYPPSAAAAAHIPRARSPQPQFDGRSSARSSFDHRPASRGPPPDSAMAVQLAPGPGDGPYPMPRGRTPMGNAGQQRPMSMYAGGPGGPGPGPGQGPGQGPGPGAMMMAPDPRGRSNSAGQQVTRDGRPILFFSRSIYMYQAAIPEELSFAKGDVMAVLRLQDDGWWEAEHTKGDLSMSRGQRRGLVPSNYLQDV